MVRQQALGLHEELLLLILRDEKGTIGTGGLYHYAMGGALLAELLLARRIAVDGSRKRKLVDLLNAEPVGEPLIDECLDRIVRARRRASLQTWVSRFGGISRLKHRVAAGLCRRGILRVEEDKILWIFTRRLYPEVDPAPEREIIARLEEAIFTDTAEVDPRTVILISLARSIDALKMVFERRRLKTRKGRIKKIIAGEMMGKAAQEAVEAVQAAVLVACIIPVVVAATSSS